ncbi:MAG TPA: hypothetical protein VGL93_24285 [Streptosporangiaceae bacterium]|jgi:hypothetical protein
MRIDPQVEDPTRTMLAHAVRGELDELTEAIRAVGDDQRFRECLGLCVAVAGYIAVDVLGPEWPTDAGLRRMAENAAKAESELDLDETQVYTYLRETAIGFQGLDRAFPTMEEMASWPIVMTASLLATFCPRDLEIWAYLDEIEEALEIADSIKPSVYPAVALQAHRREAGGSR